MLIAQISYKDGDSTLIKSITIRGDVIAVTFTTSTPSVQPSSCSFAKNMAAIEELLNTPDVGSISHMDHKVAVTQDIFDQIDVDTITHTDEDVKATQEAFDATDIGTMNQDDRDLCDSVQLALV